MKPQVRHRVHFQQYPCRRWYLMPLMLSVQFLAPPAVAQPNPEWIRVAVVRQDPQIDLQIYGRYRVVAINTGEPVHQGRRLSAVIVRALPAGVAPLGHGPPPFSVPI